MLNGGHCIGWKLCTKKKKNGGGDGRLRDWLKGQPWSLQLLGIWERGRYKLMDNNGSRMLQLSIWNIFWMLSMQGSDPLLLWIFYKHPLIFSFILNVRTSINLLTHLFWQDDQFIDMFYQALLKVHHSWGTRETRQPFPLAYLIT